MSVEKRKRLLLKKTRIQPPPTPVDADMAYFNISVRAAAIDLEPPKFSRQNRQDP